jgi:4,5:9,10-diseco-3-hydroxy-5,9,17-trioxoandrosta-1(10),2-diene-4-oate hydrolase
MTERRQIHLDGLCLSYLEQGRAAEDQPSLILIHGLMGCAETFVPLIDELGEDHAHLHVIALDLPGAGRSERRQDIDASLYITAQLVDRFLSTLNLHRPIVAGHSHGGAVAMSLAAHRVKNNCADSLRSLILLSPAHPYFDEGDPIIRFYLSLPGRMFAYAMPWFPQWMQMMGLRRMAGPQSWDSPERLKPYRDNIRTPGTMSHLLRLLRTWHKDMSGLRRALRRPLATPTLVVWGDCDRAVPLNSATELRKHLQHSELITLPGVGHRPAEEQPQLVAGLLHEWLTQSLPDTAAASIRYSPNSSASHTRIASLITPSLESGD